MHVDRGYFELSENVFQLNGQPHCSNTSEGFTEVEVYSLNTVCSAFSSSLKKNIC